MTKLSTDIRKFINEVKGLPTNNLPKRPQKSYMDHIILGMTLSFDMDSGEFHHDELNKNTILNMLKQDVPVAIRDLMKYLSETEDRYNIDLDRCAFYCIPVGVENISAKHIYSYNYVAMIDFDKPIESSPTSINFILKDFRAQLKDSQFVSSYSYDKFLAAVTKAEVWKN